MLAYKHEKFIAQAIEGVVAQRCDFPFELIVGEDCSPDNTRAIVLDYQRRYPEIIRLLTSEKNVGMHANAARSLAACRGQYVANCEGDDYWHHPHKLQMQVEAMNAADDIGLCHTDFNRQIGLNRIKQNCHLAARSPYLAKDYAYENLLHHWTVMTATTMYRRDLLEEFVASAFYQATWPFGDYNVALFAATRGRIAYLPISTATWRKVAGSATNEGSERQLKLRVASRTCREMYMDHFPVSDAVRKDCLSFANRNVMAAAFEACDLQVYLDARSRIFELGGTIRPVSDWVRLAAMRLRFPALAYGVFRAAVLRLTAERF